MNRCLSAPDSQVGREAPAFTKIRMCEVLL
jgi:hypothetical protein